MQTEDEIKPEKKKKKKIEVVLIKTFNLVFVGSSACWL
jgi:hypothetical protein